MGLSWARRECAGRDQGCRLATHTIAQCGRHRRCHRRSLDGRWLDAAVSTRRQPRLRRYASGCAPRFAIVSARPDGWLVHRTAIRPDTRQQLRREWTSFDTAHGSFALPSFRYLNIATHAPSTSAVGLKIAHPACMALAHLYEHADPDRTVISSIDPPTPRYVKDVGRAIALWWLAGQDGTRDDWAQRWQGAIEAETSARKIEPLAETRAALEAVAPRLADAFRLTKLSILAAHACELAAFRRAHASLLAAIRAA